MNILDQDFSEMLLDAALSLGADAAEVYVNRTVGTEILAGKTEIDSVNLRLADGYAVRVLRDGKLAFGSSNVCEKAAAIELVRNLARRCDLHSPDDNNILPEPPTGERVQVSEPFDPEMADLTLNAKFKKLLAVEQHARAVDPRIKGFGWLQYGDTVQETVVVNSRGIFARSRGTLAYVFAYAFAGDESGYQTGTHVEASSHFDKLSAQDAGEKVASYALRMLGASTASSGEYQIVLPPESGSAFLKSLSEMLSADRVQKGKSPLRDKLGEMIASSNVTIIDDGRLEGGLATSPFDSEGMPSQSTVLIERGKLAGFMYDSYCANRGKTFSTGNASRSSYHSQPCISPTNLYLVPGQVGAESLIRSVGNGLYVTEVSGLHAAVNPTTADFSVPAKAIAVRNGLLCEPIDGITLSGNLLHLFRSIEVVANDLTWTPADGMIGMPTIGVSSIKVTGAS
jgi:PmbA protein